MWHQLPVSYLQLQRKGRISLHKNLRCEGTFHFYQRIANISAQQQRTLTPPEKKLLRQHKLQFTECHGGIEGVRGAIDSTIGHTPLLLLLFLFIIYAIAAATILLESATASAATLMDGISLSSSMCELSTPPPPT